MKKKTVGILVCTLLIAAAVLPVAGTEENDEWENNVYPAGNQQYAFWSYHPENFVQCNGLLGVFATYNCMKIYPCLYHGYVEYCKTYYGSIPRTHSGFPVNDIMFEFVWDYCCFNINFDKIGVPYYNEDHWELENIVDWVHENVVDELNLVSIGDSTGEISEVYIAVDGNVVLEEPPIIQEEYYVVEGYCDELPGYLIGTTPIVFNPQAGSHEYPFETTPLTGTLNFSGHVSLMREESHPPGSPEINGPTSVGVGVENSWSFSSVDPNGDDIMYIIDWGDDVITDTECYPSGEDVEVCHTYTDQGSCMIRAKAKECPDGLESDWAELEVTVQRSRAMNRPFLNFLQNFLENHPNLFPILRLLLQRLGLQ